MNPIFRSATCLRGIIFAVLLTMTCSAVAQVERIDAKARGTSTQMGKDFDVKLTINRFSTPADRQALKNAFDKGGHDALVKALEDEGRRPHQPAGNDGRLDRVCRVDSDPDGSQDPLRHRSPGRHTGAAQHDSLAAVRFDCRRD